MTTVAIGLIGQYSILMRSSVIETLGEDYVTTARAKGLAEHAILRAHALPNAMLPAVTLIAINLGYVVAGAITVEVVFNWPGLGTLTVDALNAARLPGAAGLVPAPVRDRRSGEPRRRRPVWRRSTRGFDLSPRDVRSDPAGGARAVSMPVVLKQELRLVRFRSFSSFFRQFIRRPSGLIGVIVLIVFTVLAVAPGLFVGPLETVTTSSATPLEPPAHRPAIRLGFARPERPEPDRVGDPDLDDRSACWRRSSRSFSGRASESSRATPAAAPTRFSCGSRTSSSSCRRSSSRSSWRR